MTFVACVGGVDALEPGLADRRVSVSARHQEAGAVLAALAEGAGLAGADYAAPEVSLTLALDDVRLETALRAFQESTRAHVAVEGDRLVARAWRPLTGADLDTYRMTATLDEALGLAEIDCPVFYEDDDRMVAALTADAEGRIARAWVADLRASDDRAGDCVRAAVGAWADDGAGAPVAYAEIPLVLLPPLTPRQGGDAPPWIEAILDDHEAEVAEVSCEEDRCRLVVIVDSNRALAALADALEGGEGGEVYVMEIDAAPRGGKRAVIDVDLE